jgi:hypothetical protein
MKSLDHYVGQLERAVDQLRRGSDPRSQEFVAQNREAIESWLNFSIESEGTVKGEWAKSRDKVAKFLRLQGEGRALLQQADKPTTTSPVGDFNGAQQTSKPIQESSSGGFDAALAQVREQSPESELAKFGTRLQEIEGELLGLSSDQADGYFDRHVAQQLNRWVFNSFVVSLLGEQEAAKGVVKALLRATAAKQQELQQYLEEAFDFRALFVDKEVAVDDHTKRYEVKGEIPTGNKAQHGQIADQIALGYERHGQVLLPAEVRVFAYHANRLKGCRVTGVQPGRAFAGQEVLLQILGEGFPDPVWVRIQRGEEEILAVVPREVRKEGLEEGDRGWGKPPEETQEIQVTIDLPAELEAGYYEVVVANAAAGGEVQIRWQSLEILSAPPEVQQVEPRVGYAGQKFTLTLQGQRLVGVEVKLHRTGES